MLALTHSGVNPCNQGKSLTNGTYSPKGTGLAAAFALGAVLMLTNFTSLVLYLPALQDVNRARTGESAKAVAERIIKHAREDCVRKAIHTVLPID